jgi:hypothetical protein
METEPARVDFEEDRTAVAYYIQTILRRPSPPFSLGHQSSVGSELKQPQIVHAILAAWTPTLSAGLEQVEHQGIAGGRGSPIRADARKPSARYSRVVRVKVLRNPILSVRKWHIRPKGSAQVELKSNTGARQASVGPKTQWEAQGFGLGAYPPRDKTERACMVITLI